MFCDFCNCNTCKYGETWLSHAQVEENTWICDVCYLYDLCTDGPEKNVLGPCENKSCIHRPKLMSKWIKFNE